MALMANPQLYGLGGMVLLKELPLEAGKPKHAAAAGFCWALGATLGLAMLPGVYAKQPSASKMAAQDVGAVSGLRNRVVPLDSRSS